MHEEYRPQREPKRSRGFSWLFYPIALAIVIAAGAGVWYLAAPQSMARLYGRLLGPELVVNSLILTIDKQKATVTPGGSVEIHPERPFTISGLDTNRWLNYDLNLASPDFDIRLVANGAWASPKQLLGEKFFGEAPREIRLEVRDKDKIAATFTLVSRFTVLDFATKGDAAADPAVKAANYQMALHLDPDSLPLRQKLIEALNNSGQKPAAASFLEMELKRLGPDYDILAQLLGLYTEMKNVDLQISTLKRLIDLAAHQSRPQLELMRQLAEIYRQNKQPQMAAQVFEDMLNKAPKDQASAILGELVVIYREAHQTNQEITTLKRLLEVSPPEEGAAIWSKIIKLYELSGDESGRLEAWSSLAQILPEGPDKINAYKIIGQLHHKAGNLDLAIGAYDTALKMDNRDTNILLNLARLLEKKQDRSGYLTYLSRVLEVTPDNLPLRRELADAYRADGQNEKARTEYLELLAQRPDENDARLILIDILEKLGDKKELANQYGELSTRHPDEGTLAYNYGVALFNAGQMPKAIEVFKKIVAANPKDQDAREFLMAAYESQGQTKEMLAEALELYRLDPSKTIYRALLLNTYENAKNWTKFEEVAKETTRLVPDDPESWQLLYKAQSQLNKKTDGAQTLWKIAIISKDKIDPWFQAATAFSTLGNQEKVKEAYENVLKIDPNNERAAKALLDLKLKTAGQPKE